MATPDTPTARQRPAMPTASLRLFITSPFLVVPWAAACANPEKSILSMRYGLERLSICQLENRPYCDDGSPVPEGQNHAGTDAPLVAELERRARVLVEPLLGYRPPAEMVVE